MAGQGKGGREEVGCRWMLPHVEIPKEMATKYHAGGVLGRTDHVCKGRYEYIGCDVRE